MFFFICENISEKFVDIWIVIWTHSYGIGEFIVWRIHSKVQTNKLNRNMNYNFCYQLIKK